ncbi:MAG: class I SAM-dependent methyltransferase [Lachnospiraceae bacterium]|nr:class I SAM-dependent methyltransferase [Lachnospiraceae bacterium]
MRDHLSDSTKPILIETPEGLTLQKGELSLCADLRSMIPRIRGEMWRHEPLAKAASLKGLRPPMLAVDATAGLGEDALILAAIGYHVILFEQDPQIHALLEDALRRAAADPILAEPVARMELRKGDSTLALPVLSEKPDLVYLDPMFPARQKSGLIKKKFQLLQLLEAPCADEEALLNAAFAAGPRRIVIKRPAKGPFLAQKKPEFTYSGSSIRYDCFSVRISNPS